MVYGMVLDDCVWCMRKCVADTKRSISVDERCEFLRPCVESSIDGGAQCWCMLWSVATKRNKVAEA